VDRGRRYLPADVMKRYNVTDAQVEARRFDANFRAMMKFLVDDARARLQRGSKLITMVERDLGATLSLFVKGGNAILDAIAAQDYDTLQDRPVVTKAVKLRLLGGALVGRVSAALRGRSSPQGRAA
jgi:phytoene/squalene synthetase